MPCLIKALMRFAIKKLRKKTTKQTKTKKVHDKNSITKFKIT